MKRFLISLGLMSVFSFSSASGVAHAWYFGDWSCVIDHRAGRMLRKVVDDSQTTCQGGVCSSTSGVAVRGWFKDGNGGWVGLIQRSASGNDLRFTYTGDFTRWFLRYDPATGVANGNTVWRGKAYPLNCAQGKG